MVVFFEFNLSALSVFQGLLRVKPSSVCSLEMALKEVPQILFLWSKYTQRCQTSIISEILWFVFFI